MNTEKKPWGYEQIYSITNTNAGSVEVRKNLIVFKQEKLSLQMHRFRTEYWTVFSGKCWIQIDKGIYWAIPGTEWEILPMQRHRIMADGEDVLVKEVSNGYIEDDIIRLEDAYGRIK